MRRRASQLTLPGVEVAKRPHPGLDPVSRRGFFSRVLGWLTAAIAATLGIPAAAMIAAPAFRRDQSAWSPVARLAEPGPDEPDLRKVGEPILTTFRVMRGDAYVKPRLEQVPVYIINHGEERFTIFDIRCTHLGCPVSWEEKREQFLSPCHNGVFAVDGTVVDGPPPRPLDQYQAKVDKGVLYAGALIKGGQAPPSA